MPRFQVFPKEVGIPAFEREIVLLQSQEKKDVRVLEGLECWIPFMIAEMVKRLDSLRTVSNAGAKKRTIKAAVATAKPASSKSLPSAQESAEQAVMAMLKRR
eukprot:3149503-Amphidinium_carterae.1